MGGGNAFDALTLVCQSHHHRPPMPGAQKRKTFIVKPAAHAEPLTRNIEAHERRENHIEVARRASCLPRGDGFWNSKAIAPQPRAWTHEDEAQRPAADEDR